jgi:hypothetical protein
MGHQMKMAAGIGLLFLSGVGAVVTATWLASRQGVVGRAAGVVLAITVAVVCAMVTFALIADNWALGLSGFRAGGGLSLSVFVLVGLVAAFAVRRGLKLRGRVFSQI